jgi:hypothetical protein
MGQDQNVVNAESNRVNIIELIATETHRPFDEVKRVYDEEFATLKSNARIFDYLVLFATRRTRDKLTQSH